MSYQEILKDAETVFNTVFKYESQNKWALQHLPKLIETIYALPLNEKFCFVEYSTQFIDHPQASQNFIIFMPYLTGPFGLLNMTLELADGTIVTPNQTWLEQSKSPLINEPIPFTIHNGKPIFDSDVFVVFKRNSKI